MRSFRVIFWISGSAKVHFRYVGRRRWRGIAQDTFQHPHSALERIGILPVRVHGKNSGARQEPPAVQLRFDGDFPKARATDAPDADSDFANSLIDQGIVGMDEVEDAAVAFLTPPQKRLRVLSCIASFRACWSVTCVKRSPGHPDPSHCSTKCRTNRLERDIGQHAFDFGLQDMSGSLRFPCFSLFVAVEHRGYSTIETAARRLANSRSLIRPLSRSRPFSREGAVGR